MLTDEFSGYILDNRHRISEELLKKEVVTISDRIPLIIVPCVMSFIGETSLKE